MKIGITYLYTIFNYGYPPKPEDDFKAIEEIHEMGFKYLEMEGLGKEHTAGVMKYKNDFKKCLSDNDVHVHNFCIVDPNLVHLNGKVRKEAYENFKRTAELAVDLGTETLHLASYAPPIDFCGNAPYQLGEEYSFANTFKTKIPSDFNWSDVWNVLVESCHFSAEIAKEYGKKVIIEPRIGELICSPDSMLRLIEAVHQDNFMANIDTANFCAQRENVPLVLKKLEGKFANIHIADNSPENTQHLPLGKGCIDWDEFLNVLIDLNYDGYLGLDLGGGDTIVEDLQWSRSFLEKKAKKLGIDIES